jgi:transcriptional regulator, XRE family
MSLISNLSVQLRQYRREKDITLMEFSSMLGIAKSSLQRYESGEGNPTLNTVEQIGRKIHVDSGSLLLPSKPCAVSQGGFPPEQLQAACPFSRMLSQICAQCCKQMKEDA